jgi:nitroreductase
VCGLDEDGPRAHKVNGMELQDAIRKRRMVQTFDADRPVSEEALERIPRNGMRAPSAGFSQGQAWLVLRDADLKKFWELGEDLGALYFGIGPATTRRDLRGRRLPIESRVHCGTWSK